MDPLIEWDELHLRVRAERVIGIAREVIRQQKLPVEDLRMDFREGILQVEGRVRKVLAVPFRVVIRRIIAEGSVVRVPIETMSAMGFPLPALLARLIPPDLYERKVFLDPGPTVVIHIDQLLPPFMNVALREIRIIDGGLAVVTGAGAADLPEPGGMG